MEINVTNWTMLLWEFVVVVIIVFVGYKVFKKLK
jgi:hypothetical protein